MQVEIWADVACPWCYVGKRCFEAALERFEDRDSVTVTYRAFELDPDAPAAREGSVVEHLARKYGITVERATELNDQLTAVAASVGIDMRFDQVRGGNTFDAHRLIKAGGEPMVERLFRAYFTEGERLSDPATLARLAGELGVPALTGDEHADAVRADEELACAIGIQAVPFFAVDRRIGASGAQDPEVLLDMLREIGRRDAA
jgi:predicted DsbA family dithiol-disulfide isomerase